MTRKYSSTASLTSNSPQVHFHPYSHDPLRDSHFLQRSNSVPASMFNISTFSSQFPHIFNQQSMFNVYRVREYEFTQVNYSSSPSGLQQIHLSHNQLQDEFKIPLPPPPIKSRSRAIEPVQHNEAYSRPQSAPPASITNNTMCATPERKKTTFVTKKCQESPLGTPQKEKANIHPQISQTTFGLSESTNEISQAKETCLQQKNKKLEPVNKQHEESVKKRIEDWIQDVSIGERDESSNTSEISNPTSEKNQSKTKTVVKQELTKIKKSSSSTKVLSKEVKIKTKKEASKLQEKASLKLKSSHVAKEKSSKNDVKEKKVIDMQKNVGDSIVKKSSKNKKSSTILPILKSEIVDISKKRNPPKKETKIPKESTSPKTYPADLLTLSDVSTAGSSLTTDDDDFFFSGGKERHDQRHMTHRIKKLQKKKDELRKVQTETKKKENSPKIKNKIKSCPVKIESGTSTSDDEDDFVTLAAVKKEKVSRVEKRKISDDHKKVEDKKKIETRGIRKKIYENFDSDSSD